MSAPQKFMFDNSFDKKQEVIDPLEELKVKFNQKIETAKKEAFEEGRLAGKQDALDTIENQTKCALEALANCEAQLNTSYQEALKKMEAKSVEFGITAGSKLAAQLTQREPMPLLETFFKEAFQVIYDVPEVIASVNPSILEAIESASDKWKLEAGFKGNLSFVGNDNLKPTDVDLAWRDGGIQRSVDELMQAINSAMTSYFLARDQHSSQEGVPVTPPKIEQLSGEMTQDTKINQSESLS